MHLIDSLICIDKSEKDILFVVNILSFALPYEFSF